ncbi:uncharacterized protein LOC114286966 [Camellia sinensis]|uniref:uncharacterized protein LOC114286966 n=1 Tax=Camellia sinensis TaxID=4442 RepID=UPI0010362442|nr:uncharacterized protein LOC114286966 [Camellia sinensis]
MSVSSWTFWTFAISPGTETLGGGGAWCEADVPACCCSQDNILVAYEAFHSLRLKKRGTIGHMAIKLDFDKAYDQIKWDFLSEVLQKIGFHPIWTQWQQSNFGFKDHKALLIMISTKFANDMILFLKEDSGECQNVLDILQIFYEALGQKINFDKSSVQFSLNTPPTMCSSIWNLSGFQLSQSDVKYLGLPSFLGRSKAKAYEFLIERILSKLQGWK